MAGFTTFSKAQAAVFSHTGGSGASDADKLTDVVIATTRPLVNITNATGAVTAASFDDLLPTIQLTGMQIDPALGISQSSTFVLDSNTNVKPHDFTITKTWKLTPITGDAQTAMEFAWDMPVVTGQMRGWATGDTDHLQDGGALTVTFNTFGTVTIADSAPTQAYVTQLSIGIPKRRGGPVPVAIAFQGSGTIGGTAGEFSTTTEAPPEGPLTIVFSGGPALTGNALNNSITVNSPSSRGGPLEFQRSFTLNTSTGT